MDRARKPSRASQKHTVLPADNPREQAAELDVPESGAPTPCREWSALDRQPVLDTEQAAAFMGLAPATLRDWKAQRIGPPYVQFSARCVRYRRVDLEQFMVDRRVVPAPRYIKGGRYASVRGPQ